MAKRKPKKKKKPGEIEPHGKMRPAEGSGAPEGDEGTRVDDGARHVFFSFKGELKSDLPDATETDLAGNLGIQEPDESATSEPGGEAPGETRQDVDAPAQEGASDDAIEDAREQAPKGAPAIEDADATPADAGEDESPATASSGAVADDAATDTEYSAAPRKQQKQPDESRAGPVRGPDPAADRQKSASQSRKAAGPAHFNPPHEPPLGDSHAADPDDLSAEASAKAEAPQGAKAGAADAQARPKPEIPAKPPAAQAPEPPTHTDVRGDAFLPALGDVTHTEIDTHLFKPWPVPEDDVSRDAATETEVGRAKDAAPPKPPTPPKAAPSRPGKVAPVGDETAPGSETILDAFAPSRLLASRPKDEPAAASEPAAEDAAGGEELGSATILDAEGVRGPDAATRTEEGRAEPQPFADPDAETLTKDPFATVTGAQERATSEATTDALEGVAADAAPAADDAPAEVSFHDAETASQDIEPIAREAALPPLSPFDLPVDETQAITASRPEVPTGEVPPTVEAPMMGAPAFTGALFEAPEPSSPAETEPERAERPRLRSRRRDRKKPQEPLLKRAVAWARKNLDPRDFLEIVGTAAFERAKKVGAKLRTERRENRVSHTATWWRKTLVEMGILYAIVIPIELAVSGRLGSFGVHPHPYWLIVLPLAAARGLVAGLLAAGIASILYSIGATQAVTDAIFTFRNMTEPLLFFAVAFFAGELHDEQELKKRKLDRRISDLEERTGQLRQQRDVLTDANRELEKRIVDDSVQFGNLIQAARRIERSGRQEVFDLALEMAEEHCGAAASVLMLLEDGSLDYLCHRGFPSDEIGRRLAIARKSPFVQRAVSEGVAVNGLDPAEVPPQEGPLVVAPLFDSGGVVKALMCLDEIPLARLNESTVTVFLGIADWASAALARLTRGADAPAPRASGFSVGPEVDLWLGTVAELGRRLRIELARSSRYGVPTSFLTVQATDWKDATREGIDALDRFVLMHFTTGLRPSDAIYRFGYPGAYLLVLAGTSLQGAEVVRTRLERRIAYTPSAFGAIEIVATGPDAEAPDIMSLIGRCAKNFRERSRLPLEARCPVAVPGHIEAEDLNAFLRRLKMETSLAVRNGLDLHVVGISAESSEQAGPGILARHVVEVGDQTLRPTDGVYMIGQYQCSVILPCTNGEEAATVAHRLATLVRARDPSAPYGQIETQVLGLGPTHPDAGSFLTALARRGKESSR
ncbi:MAG TPA: hypothetical protein VFY93_16245 [Planctomycetota bacterium]|nr:hypothetical protein [Planctomycetota bacterium]